MLKSIFFNKINFSFIKNKCKKQVLNTYFIKNILTLNTKNKLI